MNLFARAWNSIGGRFLVRTRRVAVLATTGAWAGLPRRAPVGCVARHDGSFPVGAGSPTGRGWTGNLTWGDLFVLETEA